MIFNLPRKIITTIMLKLDRIIPHDVMGITSS